MMKTVYVPISIFAIVLVLMSGVPFMSGVGGGSNAYARYVRSTQTQVNRNDCDNGSNCAITSPQTQGDGSVSSPNNVQISKFNEQGQNNEVGVGAPVDLLVKNCTLNGGIAKCQDSRGLPVTCFDNDCDRLITQLLHCTSPRPTTDPQHLSCTII